MLVSRKPLLIVYAALIVTIGCLSMLREATASQERTERSQSKVESLGQKSVDELIGDLRKGDKGAIPTLTEAFEKSTDRREKQRIASNLLSFGVRDKVYLDYLIKFAKPAIESKMPYPFPFDSEGRGVKGKLSPEFIAWTERNKLDPKTAASIAFIQLPRDVMYLSMAGDSRSFDLLLKGLQSRNYMVAFRASQGLAKLQDRRAIKPIIQAAQRAPAEAAHFIAEPLVYFDDAEAQAAVEEFIRNKALLDSIRNRAKERGVKGIFGF